MSKTLYIVPSRSNFPRYEEDEDGNRIEKEPNPPAPPQRWGAPSTRYRVDVPVVAASKDEARRLVRESEFTAAPLENHAPFEARHLGEMPEGTDGS